MVKASSMPLAARTLHKRMREKGLLVTCDADRQTVRKAIEGNRRQVLHIRASSLYATGNVPNVPNAPKPQIHEGNAPISRYVSADGPEKRATETYHTAESSQDDGGQTKGETYHENETYHETYHEKPQKTQEITQSGTFGTFGTFLGDDRDLGSEQHLDHPLDLDIDQYKFLGNGPRAVRERRRLRIANARRMADAEDNTATEAPAETIKDSRRRESERLHKYMLSVSQTQENLA